MFILSATTLPPEEIDARLGRLTDGVDLALRRAKVWSKYAKDVMTYIEKRCSAGKSQCSVLNFFFFLPQLNGMKKLNR